MSALDTNDFVYEELLHEVSRRQRKGEEILEYIEFVVGTAYDGHPGRFADGSLENLVLREGRRLEDSVSIAEMPVPTRTQSRTLHVASEVHTTGGHSRVLAKWVQRDLSSSHSVVLTRQNAPIPAFLQNIWTQREVSVTAFDACDPLQGRARRLRAIAREFDRVILHQHPHDTVPVLAFANPGGPPVAMFNHAHFWFSLGSTVSDMIINTMPYLRQMSQKYRFAKETALLTGMLGLEPLRWTNIDKATAKEHLGLNANQPVVLTIANGRYFTPMGGYDFFSTAEKLLEKNRELCLIVVGLGPESPLVSQRLKQTGRIRLLGRVEDPRPYYRAADVSLESFPMSSLGGFWETVAYGEAFPVQIYGPGENILHLGHPLFDRFAPRARTEREYLDCISDLLAAKVETREKAAQIRKEIVEEDLHYGDQFPRLYQRLDALKHSPQEIPNTECCRDEDCHVLASLLCPPVGRTFDRLLPFSTALMAHARAVRSGHENISTAGARISRHAFRAILKGGRRT